MQVTVPEQGKSRRRRGVVLTLVSSIVITSMVIPLIVIDIFCTFYHAVYFRINGMPLIARGNYIVLDRGRLKGLNIFQRWNCLYCDYANGLIAWTKAVINVTEVYNCAIKHGTAKRGQEHQTKYYERARFS